MNDQLVAKLQNVRVLVIGDVMLDRYWWGTVDRISPEAPVPVVSVNDVTLVAGGAANVAANVIGLGSVPYLVGITGEDEDSALLATAIEAAGITSSKLFKIADRKTSVKNRVVSHNQQMLRFDRETTTPINIEIVNEILPAIINALDECDVVVVSDYGKGFLTPELLSHLIAGAKVQRKPVLVDPKGKDYDKYYGATMVTPNQREAEEACGLPLCDDTVDTAGARLLSDLGLKFAIITRGERGMRIYSENASPIELPATARRVYNVTGAGDTVIATLAVGLGSGLSIIESAQLANFAAGLVIENVGTTAIDLSMLQRHSAEHEIQ